jgi:phenylalanyl-tRNA synthetase beta chain
VLVSLKWLRDYVDLPADVDVQEFADQLTMASAEVDGIAQIGHGWDRALVVVGEVLSVDLHPDADRLRLATVNYGGANPQQVVCGAPNLAVGQRIAFGREGAELRNMQSGKLQKLKANKIRGVESAGMVLSEAELGISESHERIIELPTDAPIGMPLVDYLGDVVLDVHIWPNRADMMSMVGVAREVAAIIGSKVREPDVRYSALGGPVADAVSVEIEDAALCARYVATVIQGVQIAPSPAWLQERLVAAGQRPINNVVDITNFVMFELGQPLHSFDLDKVEGTVVVRTAREGEILRTLDGIDRELETDTLLITDDRGPIGLAGVMGGENSEVSEGTTQILLEAARFDPVSIRRTSTKLGLRSEASSRFERRLSPELAMEASRRATKLFVEVCGGTALSGTVDAYPGTHELAEVAITRERLDRLLGFHVPTVEVEQILGTLGFDMLESDGESSTGSFRVRTPWWRTDIAIADDLAEEVVRLAGYDRLPESTILGRTPVWEPSPHRTFRDAMRDALADAGWQEVITYSLTTDEVLERVMPVEYLTTIRPLRLENTLSSDREVMRPTLRHALIEVVDRNIRAGAPEVAVFEAAVVFLPRDGEPLPEERSLVTGAMSGVDLDRWGRPTDRQLDFFDAKGALDLALNALDLDMTYEADSEYGMMPGQVARLKVGDESVGMLAEVHPDTLAQFGIEQPVTLFELDLEKLLSHVPSRKELTSIARFPAVEQDVAVVVAEDVTAGVLQTVFEGSPLVVSAVPFDVYRGEQLGAGKKSVALSVRYQAPNRTLTQEDADREQGKVLKRLQKELGAELRGSSTPS